MSSTPAAPNDPIPISLPERLLHLSHEVTPAMGPLVSLLQNLAKAAPSAIRNKHKLYSIILRASEICDHLLAMGTGPEPIGLESLDEYCNIMDSLEEHLLRTAGFLDVEQGPLSPGLCSYWSETRAGLAAIMDGLYKSPFTFDRSSLEDELAKNTLFDDCYWFSFLLHEGIEKELDLRFSSPEAVAAVKENLGYLEREVKHGHLSETVRGSAINIASRLYENMAAFSAKEEGDAASSVPQPEPSFISASQDALIKELFDAFSKLNLESFPETKGPQMFAETKFSIAEPPPPPTIPNDPRPTPSVKENPHPAPRIWPTTSSPGAGSSPTDGGTQNLTHPAPDKQYRMLLNTIEQAGYATFEFKAERTGPAHSPTWVAVITVTSVSPVLSGYIHIGTAYEGRASSRASAKEAACQQMLNLFASFGVHPTFKR
ncbi:hypothetical protein FRC01_006555 [Tulasnella sp. 417]|nr:hypothetical protein FRC01_006555 [Tulasnella sp. 417]